MRQPISPQTGQAEASHRYDFHIEAGTTWSLVVDGHNCNVEVCASKGVQTYALEEFEATPDGLRLANSLTVAMARLPS